MSRSGRERNTMLRFASASDAEAVAGGGLLSRRAVLKGALVMGAGAAFPAQAVDEPFAAAMPWQKLPGRPPTGYGSPSRFEDAVTRTTYHRYGAVALGNGGSFTPLQQLRGTITPNGLHFERHHNGVPDIDPAKHRLAIHGLVSRPLQFSIERLSRYPMTTMTAFLECSGNSFPNTADKPAQVTCGEIHGLASCSEWTGVPLAMLLDEAGVAPTAQWLVAEGADAASMTRSIPLEKARYDGLLALYQNGERLRPEQGYPMRLLLPGWEGNMSVKWLRRIELVSAPVQARDETSHYTDALPDGRALQFTFEMGVKSVITQPSPGWMLQAPGYYDISGLAWSGAGHVARVDVSADDGRTWAEAELVEPVQPYAFTRFRLPWRWDGKPVRLMSRAMDEREHTQPTRAEWLQRYGAKQRYHYNAIQVWQVDDMGEVSNVY